MRTRTFAALLAAAALAPAAAWAADWASPQTLSSSGRADFVTASVGSDGATRVAWSEGLSAPTVDIATRAAGADAFAASRSLVTLTPYDSFTTTGFDGAGRAVVVFYRHHTPYTRARVVLQRADGTTTAPVTISAKGHSVSSVPTLAVDPAGDAVAGWTWYDGHTDVPQIAIRPAGRRFAAPVTLGSTTQRSGFAPEVAIGPGGQIVAAYETAGKVYAVTGDVADGVGKPQLLGSYRPNYGPIVAAINGSGRAVVAWMDVQYAETKGATQMHAAIAEAGQPFGDATTLGNAEDDDGTPAAAVTTTGTVLVAYTAAGHLATAVAPRGAGFGGPSQLAAIDQYSVSPVLSDGPSGSAILAWTHSGNAPGGGRVVSVAMASEYHPGSGFDAPVALSAPAEEALTPAAALGSSAAAVAWIQSPSGSGEGNVKAATSG